MDEIEFIKESKAIHNNKYDYSNVRYINKSTKVGIICHNVDSDGNEHGIFWQSPKKHLIGQGCPKCNGSRKITTDEFIRRAKEVHGDKYNYSKADYKGNKIKVCIICPEHGEFWQTPVCHLLQYQGCPSCGKERVSKKLSYTKEDFVKRANKIHMNKYDYSITEYININTKINIICPEHGCFQQTPHDHLKGCGCPKCGIISRSDKKRKDIETFIEEAKIVHKDKYDYSKTIYGDNNTTKVCIICPEHGEFWQTPHNHLSGYGCPKCAISLSLQEDRIVDFINSIYDGKIIQRERTILRPKELDIYIPYKHLAIEYDGLIWHSERYKRNDIMYHLNKTNECADKGIRLIHIFEDEWLERPQIVKSIISNLFGKTKERIYARKCKVKEVKVTEAKQFLNSNNLFGECDCRYYYGLYYDNCLVSLMSFSETVDTNSYELLRFCSRLNYNVLGGASKLLKHFIDEVRPKTIITKVDKRWSTGELFYRLGFTHKHNNRPDYFYVVQQKRIDKSKFQKDIMVKQKYVSNKSEHEIMLECGIPRIFDCGTMVFEKKLY